MIEFHEPPQSKSFASWRLGGLLAIATAFSGSTAIAAMPIQLVPNSATYDLQLEHSSPGGAVAAHGRMVIQFRDTCDGWSTAQRTITDVTDGDGAFSRSDYLISVWESRDGKNMRFDVKSVADGKLDKEKRGAATLAGNGIAEVTLLSPIRRRFRLPAGTVFPTGQTLALIAGAAHGEENVKRLVFEGGDEGDLYISTAVIGRAASPQAVVTDHAADSTGLIRNVPAWTMLVGYFDNKRSADLPDYEVSARLYANGISGSMSLVFSRYTLRATLTRLEPLVPSCPIAEAAKAVTAQKSASSAAFHPDP